MLLQELIFDMDMEMDMKTAATIGKLLENCWKMDIYHDIKLWHGPATRETSDMTRNKTGGHFRPSLNSVLTLDSQCQYFDKKSLLENLPRKIVQGKPMEIVALIESWNFAPLFWEMFSTVVGQSLPASLFQFRSPSILQFSLISICDFLRCTNFRFHFALISIFSLSSIFWK